MKGLDFGVPSSHAQKRLIQLRQVVKLHRDVELAEVRGAKAKLPPSNPKRLQVPPLAQVAQVRFHSPNELEVVHSWG